MIDWTFLRDLARRVAARLRLADDRSLALEAPLAPAVPSPSTTPPPRDGGDDGGAARRRARGALIEALNPTLPVENRDRLLGREAELASIFSAIADLRGHALVHGARGAGKTSLARAFGDYADERGLLVLYLSCDGGGEGSAGFADLFRPYLDFLPDSCFARGDVGEARDAIAALPADFGPRALAAVLARVTGERVVLIVDEFDRVADPAIRADVATLAKHLSDLRTPVHLLLVGIARDAQELVRGHASLRRHLVAIGLRRFGPDSAERLLDEGERAASLRFDPQARRLIAGIAAGSPYHLRLFAFHAAMAAIERGDAHVTVAALGRALAEAFDHWAALNPVAARAFERAAAEGPAQRRRLEALALSALDLDVVTPDALARRLGASPAATSAAEETIERIRPALVPADADGGASGVMFEDTLAPQFLLLSCCLAERGGAAVERDAA